jgi:hypothetical protein
MPQNTKKYPIDDVICWINLNLILLNLPKKAPDFFFNKSLHF